VVERVLEQDRSNEAAQALKRRLDERARNFEVGTSMSLDFFDGGSAPWREHTVRLKSETPIGSVIAKASRAYRFGNYDDLFEIEAYPRIRTGTYAYVSGGIGRRHE